MSTITQRMQQHLERWQKTADQRSDFLRCYQIMTENMLTANEAGEFNDPEWVYSLLHQFAEYYFDALDSYDQGRPDTPQVWRLAFDSARQPDSQALQNLLLGINAHINYDLIFTLVDMLNPDWQTLSVDERQGRYDDHCHINTVISRTIDTVQETIIEIDLPLMHLFDEVFGKTDEWFVSRMITRWRDEVWEYARLLLDNPDPDESRMICEEIENQALHRAQLIKVFLPGG